eukprot:gnl/TRDRNA2_/TRDRNA2_175631_c10_seq3.p1 gnl/TRDRNA2_/TRDRNA2_175631_c10~~gnl/TRDRNA2_/TRDRNA2_175631_c10_seq3.p1  ORF type:complete len:206 (-),score=5.80 gnl/TRDRNA2_/TRDRNA2_175631_c10_seq3:61-678(-)
MHSSKQTTKVVTSRSMPNICRRRRPHQSGSHCRAHSLFQTAHLCECPCHRGKVPCSNSRLRDQEPTPFAASSPSDWVTFADAQDMVAKLLRLKSHIRSTDNLAVDASSFSSGTDTWSPLRTPKPYRQSSCASARALATPVLSPFTAGSLYCGCKFLFDVVADAQPCWQPHREGTRSRRSATITTPKEVEVPVALLSRTASAPTQW